MAVRGTQAKELITKTILTIFKDSFINDKEIRIPATENGEEVQIKITLTAAKTNIEHGGNSEKKESLVNVNDVVPIGPLTDEQKDKILKSLKDIIDIDLEPLKTLPQDEELPF